MGLIAVILMIGILASIYEVPSFIKKKQTKEVIIYVSFLLIGIGFSIPIGLGVDLPSPLALISVIFKPVSDLLEAMLT